MNPALWLARTARLSPIRPALLRGTGIDADYAGFAARAAAIGAGLAARHGIGPGDRVALFLKNATTYLECLYGAWWAGAAVVPINAKLHAREAAWILENAGASLVFSSRGQVTALGGLTLETTVLDTRGADMATLRASEPGAAPCPMKADSLTWLFYTSGTTGRPKGVMITAGNLQAMTLAYFADVDRVEAQDAALYAAPLSHGAGLYNFMHVLRGARHVVPESEGFDAAEILDLAPRLGDVHMFAAPTMVRRLVDAAKTGGGEGQGIRTIVYGGGPMYRADIEEAVDMMGPRFVQIYGQGECPMAISALPRALVADRTHPRWRERLASVGTAQSCVELRIADEKGDALPSGETGEIMVRGTPVMAGYWRNPSATAAAIRDGWLATGDLGALDADGFLTLQDRSKDLIISGGTNIYPREIEEVLLEHSDVHEAAVVGHPHPEWGEEVVAFITPAVGSTLDPAAMDRHCLDRIARFKRPKRYLTCPALPKNNYGKVLKTELRRRLADHDASLDHRSR
ncbi:MAG: AMP-binding protein [Pseudomonadota bacterium]